MKTSLFSVCWSGLALLALALGLTGTAGAEEQSVSLPFSEIGAKATADYQGDALGITATAEGARLRCGFQKLDGHATTEGLWLTSTAPNSAGRLRLIATAVGREQSSVRSDMHLAGGQRAQHAAPDGA